MFLDCTTRTGKGLAGHWLTSYSVLTEVKYTLYSGFGISSTTSGQLENLSRLRCAVHGILQDFKSAIIGATYAERRLTMDVYVASGPMKSSHSESIKKHYIRLVTSFALPIVRGNNELRLIGRASLVFSILSFNFDSVLLLD